MAARAVGERRVDFCLRSPIAAAVTIPARGASAAWAHDLSVPGRRRTGDRRMAAHLSRHRGRRLAWTAGGAALRHAVWFLRAGTQAPDSRTRNGCDMTSRATVDLTELLRELGRGARTARALTRDQAQALF